VAVAVRAEELCRLKPEHVHLGRRSGHVAVYGKRNKYREVPLNSTAREELTSYLRTLPHGAAYLFSSRKRAGSAAAGPLSQRALAYLLGRLALRAQVRDVSPHDLRHRFGYRMAQTVPLHRLAQLMGHDSLDTTLRYVRQPAGPAPSRRDDRLGVMLKSDDSELSVSSGGPLRARPEVMPTAAPRSPRSASCPCRRRTERHRRRLGRNQTLSLPASSPVDRSNLDCPCAK
jgi:hypothetical protein